MCWLAGGPPDPRCTALRVRRYGDDCSGAVIGGLGMSEVAGADSLADQLSRSVEIDDCSLRPLAVTTQHGELDDVRIRSVLQRYSAPEVVEYAFSLDIPHATGPVRYPPNVELGTLPRVCIPLRAQDELHGYLWLIESPPLNDDEISAAVETAGAVADVLHQQSRAVASALDREIALVGAVLTPPHRVGPPAELVQGEPLLAFETPLTVSTTRVVERGGDPLNERTMRSAVEEAVYARPTSGALLGHAPDAVSLILSTEVRADRLRPFHQAIAKAAQRRGWVVYGTGTGSPASDLDELRQSALQAAYAVRVAHARKTAQLSWSDLGTDLVFFGVPWTPATLEILFPGAMRLLDPDNALICEGLEAYLECGGDTRKAATRLAVHRTTLYYRLDRARELLGTGWEHGERRTGLHPALRLAMLLRNR